MMSHYPAFFIFQNINTHQKLLKISRIDDIIQSIKSNEFVTKGWLKMGRRIPRKKSSNDTAVNSEIEVSERHGKRNRSRSQNGDNGAMVAQEISQTLDTSVVKKQKTENKIPLVLSAKGEAVSKTSASRKIIFRDDEVLSANNNATQISKKDLLEASTSLGKRGNENTLMPLPVGRIVNQEKYFDGIDVLIENEDLDYDDDLEAPEMIELHGIPLPKDHDVEMVEKVVSLCDKEDQSLVPKLGVTQETVNQILQSATGCVGGQIGREPEMNSEEQI